MRTENLVLTLDKDLIGGCLLPFKSWMDQEALLSSPDRTGLGEMIIRITVSIALESSNSVFALINGMCVLPTPETVLRCGGFWGDTRSLWGNSDRLSSSCSDSICRGAATFLFLSILFLFGNIRVRSNGRRYGPASARAHGK